MMLILQDLSESINYFWNLEYQNTYSNYFYGQYNYQNNSLGKSVWNKSEAPMIFFTSKVAQVSTF